MHSVFSVGTFDGELDQNDEYKYERTTKNVTVPKQGPTFPGTVTTKQGGFGAPVTTRVNPVGPGTAESTVNTFVPNKFSEYLTYIIYSTIMFVISTRNFPPDVGGIQNLMEGLSKALLDHGPVKIFADIYANSERICSHLSSLNSLLH